MRVLLVDDDKKLGELLRDYFQPYGLELSQEIRPSEVELKGLGRFEVLLLDVMLPEMDGFRFLQRVREASEIPVIMLTARGDTADRVMGLELGADDYLPKPFEPRELIARIHSLSRRVNKSSNPSSLKLEPRQRRAFLEGQDLELTTMEFELLNLLVENAGQAVTRDQIMDLLQGIDSDVFSRSVDVLVSRLRQKLGDDAKKPRFVRTARGAGYIFIGES